MEACRRSVPSSARAAWMTVERRAPDVYDGRSRHSFGLERCSVPLGPYDDEGPKKLIRRFSRGLLIVSNKLSFWSFRSLKDTFDTGPISVPSSVNRDRVSNGRRSAVYRYHRDPPRRRGRGSRSNSERTHSAYFRLFPAETACRVGYRISNRPQCTAGIAHRWAESRFRRPQRDPGSDQCRAVARL